MNYLRKILVVVILAVSTISYGQDLATLNGKPHQETSSDGARSIYLLPNSYSGSIRMQDDKFYDGVQLRYDIVNDEIEYSKDSALFRISDSVKEFTIPSGIDLYTFRSGFPTIKGLTGKSFYRVMYDGETKLLKRYQSQIKEEKANATVNMEPDAKLYIVKGDKLSAVSLKDKNSFLKLLTDEKNKMQWVIKEENLEFDGDDDLVKLLEEYDSYKAGRGGN